MGYGIFMDIRPHLAYRTSDYATVKYSSLAVHTGGSELCPGVES